MVSSFIDLIDICLLLSISKLSFKMSFSGSTFGTLYRVYLSSICFKSTSDILLASTLSLLLNHVFQVNFYIQLRINAIVGLDIRREIFLEKLGLQPLSNSI